MRHHSLHFEKGKRKLDQSFENFGYPTSALGATKWNQVSFMLACSCRTEQSEMNSLNPFLLHQPAFIVHRDRRVSPLQLARPSHISFRIPVDKCIMNTELGTSADEKIKKSFSASISLSTIRF
jgi:hypothetical protein